MEKWNSTVDAYLSTDAGKELLAGYDGDLTIVLSTRGGNKVISQGVIRIDTSTLRGGMFATYFEASEPNSFIRRSALRTLAHESYHALSTYDRHNENKAVLFENRLMNQYSSSAGNRAGYNRAVSQFDIPSGATILD